VTRDEALSQLYSLVTPPGGAGAADSLADVQREIVRVVSPAAAEDAGDRGSSRSRVGDQLAVITQQLDLLRTVQQSQADLVGQNTKAVSDNTASAVASAAKGVGGALLNGFGVSPIVSGLLKLFGGGSSSSPAEVALPKYAAPGAVRLDAGLVGGEVAAVDRGVGDRVRVPGGAASTQVTVQVNAMDSRSFLDRSDEIAKAVRLAMLESHAINDVVAEL
jgi:hypothetical protein